MYFIHDLRFLIRKLNCKILLRKIISDVYEQFYKHSKQNNINSLATLNNVVRHHIFILFIYQIINRVIRKIENRSEVMIQ